MRFRAWYSGGRTFDGRDSEAWKALPADGMVWVTVFRETGRTFYNGGDWYYLDGAELRYVPSRTWGQDEPRPTDVCLACVKRGVGVPDDEFERIQLEARRATYGD